MIRLVTLALLAGLAALPVRGAAQAPATGSVARFAAGAPRPGDVIRLRIWQEPEMSGDFTVDETGVVVLPRVGRVRVVEESPEALENRLVAEYQKYLTHSSIEVVHLRRIQVLGAVRNPGLYPVDATMTVSDALALAGGPTTEGRQDRIELVRDGKRIEGRLSANRKLANTEIQSGDQLFVPERGWITRNSGIVAAGVTAGVSLIIAVLTR